MPSVEAGQVKRGEAARSLNTSIWTIFPSEIVNAISANRELAMEASTTAPHRDLGMTYSPLGMIKRNSELLVSGYLVPAR